jgi:NAD(P)-dependent dehydrogenase (short-subunit alcohol dehydrogenase family)
MTKSAALDWAKQGVRVNSVDPGFVDTLMLEQAKQDQQVMDAIVVMTPMGRLARPEEIAPWWPSWRPTRLPSSPARGSTSTASGRRNDG